MDIFGNYKVNENYGGGVFNRRIHIVKKDNTLFGALEDCNHGFKVTIHHDGKVVTDIQPEFMRVPFTTCDSADKPIRELIGASLNSSLKDLLQHAEPVKNCTHLYDLCCWTILQSQYPETEITYDVLVGDAVEGVSDLSVARNGKVLHQWQAKNGELISPENLQGKPLFVGFYHWVNEAFSGLELEAALVLQKGNLVSVGRMLDVDGMAGGRASDEHDRNACHTYSPENRDEAIRIANTTRDFTNAPEKLLKFLP